MSTKKDLKDLGEYAIELIKALRSTGAACAKLTFKDSSDDTPICGVVILDGVPETGEVIAAIEKVEDSWDKEDAAPPEIDEIQTVIEILSDPNRSFDWEETPEGERFWGLVRARLEDIRVASPGKATISSDLIKTAFQEIWEHDDRMEMLTKSWQRIKRCIYCNTWMVEFLKGETNGKS